MLYTEDGMAINFKLGPWRTVGPDDDMDRTWVGWKEDLTAEQIYANNRGIWILGPRADQEQYATFSVRGVIQYVVEIDDIETISSKSGRKPKRAIRGRLLSSGHPAYLALIGREVDGNRNPVTYIPDDPADEPERPCACGCGEATVKPPRSFAAGHDQRAVRERITRRWGSTLAFMRWFDAQEDRDAA